MKIKTIGELRELLLENDGILTIGKLSIQYKAKEDIDIHFDDNLIEWIDGTIGDSVKFIGEDYFTLSTDFEEGKKAIHDNRELKKELAEVKTKIAESSIADGKVAAYEKLLIGRTVTLGQ